MLQCVHLLLKHHIYVIHTRWNDDNSQFSENLTSTELTLLNEGMTHIIHNIHTQTLRRSIYFKGLHTVCMHVCIYVCILNVVSILIV